MSYALQKPRSSFWSVETLKKLIIPVIFFIGGI